MIIFVQFIFHILMFWDNLIILCIYTQSNLIQWLVFKLNGAYNKTNMTM